MCGNRSISVCGYVYIHANLCTYVYEKKRKKTEKKEEERRREPPVAFPPGAYPPPLLDGAGERKREVGRKGDTKEGKKRRESERSATHRRPRNCLRFCFTSRGYLSIAFIDFSHSPSPSPCHSALGRSPSSARCC